MADRNNACYQIRALNSLLSSNSILSFYYPAMHAELWDAFLILKQSNIDHLFFNKFKFSVPTVYSLQILTYVFSKRDVFIENNESHDYNISGKISDTLLINFV